LRVHYLQHVPYEGLGSIHPWLKQEESDITSTRFFESPKLPDPNDLDMLIIMGGPMSVRDESEFPWLVEEKQFIRTCIDKKKSVLGICLGAQLIANAMGANVYRNPETEIGWFPIEGLTSFEGKTMCLPLRQMVFHWHSETFDIPDGAHCVARSEGCENQAFQLGKSVIGFQFHLESTPDTVQDLVSHSNTEIIPSKFVQKESSMINDTDKYHNEVNELMNKVLSYLMSL
jgi:GMP synthase-like glutamine amidotransferase